jgi:outer membrane protein assembly factor BamB
VVKSYRIAMLGWAILLEGAHALFGASPADWRKAMTDEKPGVVAVLGKPRGEEDFIDLLKAIPGAIVYCQSADMAEIQTLRRRGAAAGLLGRQLFVEGGRLDSIHLTENLVDCLFVADGALDQVVEAEILRVLRPAGKAWLGDRIWTKPIPPGLDDWSHPYHGPDNNPQSTDQYVHGDFETQFIADPKFSPMPEQTVIAGGRMFKAMGHIAHKANQNAMLNTLLCINAYNGTILWRRALPEGFMLHRNTMIATDDALYMGDHQSCKVLDARTGEIRRELTVPTGISDGPVWKWMAMEGEVLYGLVGNLEVDIETVRSSKPGLGHWPWGMWAGHDYNDPRTAFGYGRTIVAMDRHSGQLLWHYRDDEFLDARTFCMKQGSIYCLSPEKFLMGLDAQTGQLRWKNSTSELLEAIGPNERAQHYITGYATTGYMKCNEDYLFLAGPQRKKMVVASTKDGSLAWANEVGNLQLVLRQDAIYAAGPEKTSGMVLDYASGNILASLPARRACTRATGCLDSIFFRATGGTVRMMIDGNQGRHIAPMRPPCQDGVLIANGHLYWGPWMCGCQLSLYGNIGLKPIAKGRSIEQDWPAIEAEALVTYTAKPAIAPLPVRDNDWLAYRGGPDRRDQSHAQPADKVEVAWRASVVERVLPTAPIAAGDRVFVADRTGGVHAFAADGQKLWSTYAAGPIFYPPTIVRDRLFFGCADGRVYALEAASGNLLWTFRVGPEDRWLPVYGQLVSRWPVAAGVVADGDTIYAAAGLTHYDGTYIVALDAASGRLRARNDRSGTMSAAVQSGVSMQGELSIVDGELRFAGGGIYELARYDLQTLACLNEPKHLLSSEYRTAFYAWYPEYDKYVSLSRKLEDGRLLSHDASYDGSNFSNLALLPPEMANLPPGPKKDLAGEFLRRRGKVDTQVPVWRDRENRRFTSFVIVGQHLLAAWHSEHDPGEAYLSSIAIADGSEAWRHPLAANAVKGGLAVDGAGRLLLTLENGELLCFTGQP